MSDTDKIVEKFTYIPLHSFVKYLGMVGHFLKKTFKTAWNLLAAFLHQISVPNHVQLLIHLLHNSSSKRSYSSFVDLPNFQSQWQNL